MPFAWACYTLRSPIVRGLFLCLVPSYRQLLGSCRAGHNPWGECIEHWHRRTTTLNAISTSAVYKICARDESSKRKRPKLFRCPIVIEHTSFLSFFHYFLFPFCCWINLYAHVSNNQQPITSKRAFRSKTITIIWILFASHQCAPELVIYWSNVSIALWLFKNTRDCFKEVLVYLRMIFTTTMTYMLWVRIHKSFFSEDSKLVLSNITTKDKVNAEIEDLQWAIIRREDAVAVLAETEEQVLEVLVNTCFHNVTWSPILIVYQIAIQTRWLYPHKENQHHVSIFSPKILSSIFNRDMLFVLFKVHQTTTMQASSTRCHYWWRLFGTWLSRMSKIGHPEIYINICILTRGNGM